MMKGPVCPCCQQDVDAQLTRDALITVTEMLLMFYEASTWTDVERARWRELSGSEDATTRALCNGARKALRTAGIK